KHNGIYDKKKRKENDRKGIKKRKLVQELQIEERNENGEGCSKKVKVDNIRNQEGELASKKRTFIEEVGKSILDWIKGFPKKTWISESWFKKVK
ncbi:3207_t:CDS:1, partial [Gigaspora margarita]